MEAIKGGEKAGCHFEWAGLLTEAVLLGNIAIRTGQRIEWDAPNARVTNVESANKLVAQPYRSGWDAVTGKQINQTPNTPHDNENALVYVDRRTGRAAALVAVRRRTDPYPDED